ncbi:hypothetical protein TRAPUB_13097 [Trametes pubescens]|uniref:Uncharacterized protein n=1 Tax=Trametes pubescens TaxID=154538 RepID=A0A1M2VS33_TRAPU|nr:hypothetical protein TRAPUB_13097 [Trametes pubescens]
MFDHFRPFFLMVFSVHLLIYIAPICIKFHLWLRQGTGNANFFYASTLVFGMGNGGALLDAVWAGLRIAIGELKEGYEVAQE